MYLGRNPRPVGRGSATELEGYITAPGEYFMNVEATLNFILQGKRVTKLFSRTPGLLCDRP